MATPAHFRHFQAIAEAESSISEERISEALRTPPGERILAGFAMGALVKWTPEVLAQVDADVDGEAELARRWLALGRPGAPR